MTPTAAGIIGIVVLVILLFSGMPVAFVMALVGLAGFAYLVSTGAGLALVARDVFESFSSYTLTVIPMFILMGEIAFNSGTTRKLYESAYAFLGRLPGGLAIATIGGCAAFSAICGSTNATAAAMGTIALPEMKRYNYQPTLATGCVAAGGSLGVLIPPSVVFIIYGILTGESIGKLFLAGIFPGLVLAALFMITISIICQLHPSYGPVGERIPFKRKLASLAGVVDMLILFALVMGGLFTGFFTPTEAGAIGAAAILLLVLIKRRITWQGFIASVRGTIRLSCMVMLILAGATIFGHFMSVSRIPFQLADWIGGVGLPPVVVMAGIILFYLIGGCIMSGLALVMITVPIFFPVIQTIGFDPILFGVIIVLVTEMGVITPPVGVNVYIIKGVARDVPLETIFKGTFPFLGALIVCTVIVIAFPQISLFLPGLMG